MLFGSICSDPCRQHFIQYGQSKVGVIFLFLMIHYGNRWKLLIEMSKGYSRIQRSFQESLTPVVVFGADFVLVIYRATPIAVQIICTMRRFFSPKSSKTKSTPTQKAQGIVSENRCPNLPPSTPVASYHNRLRQFSLVMELYENRAFITVLNDVSIVVKSCLNAHHPACILFQI